MTAIPPPCGAGILPASAAQCRKCGATNADRPVHVETRLCTECYHGRHPLIATLQAFHDALNAAGEICAEMLDSQDRRVINLQCALADIEDNIIGAAVAIDKAIPDPGAPLTDPRDELIALLVDELQSTASMVSCDSCDGKDNGRDGQCIKCWGDTQPARRAITTARIVQGKRS